MTRKEFERIWKSTRKGIFTTLRRSTPWKRERYKSLIGQVFEVVERGDK
jgi:hypothetical protein